ncbi:hypothetical protein N5J23_15030 [Comamonas aquatica]|uniref:Adenosine deaminase n=1 Tax=Comamonas aquatica TaxID=225991 RepID=A0AA42W3W6_9BURK|nr:hypothetical protein [Comamonas aquatica]MDH1428154.1 hypothetical protein [Comamonas aquatica]MDH1607108.1 hypothetical protein [Comamonas aquatica]MDH1618866.1 hypothetical protein [Comamonas aquatica]MDH2006842.1 hypothetical protein [Comamonas aquatica]
MAAAHAPQLALLCCRTLSSPLVRQHLLATDWSVAQDLRDLRQQLYLSNQRWQARLPDHVFDLAFEAARQQGLTDKNLADAALRLLAAQFLDVQQGQVQVKLERFGEWQQSVLSRVSSVPIVAAMQALHVKRGGHLAGHDSVEVLIGHPRDQALPCPMPRDGAIEDYIGREGLHESHLHLNGSTFAEQCWLRALTHPNREARLFSELWQASKRSPARDRVQELARLHENRFTPGQLRRDLLMAGRLRAWLVYAALNPGNLPSNAPWCADDLCGYDGACIAPQVKRPYVLKYGGPAEQLSGELDWLTRLLCQPQLSIRVARMLHLYLLLQHQYRELLVQGEELYGFDQFQKYTLTELRTPAERSYVQRLLDMHGPHEQRSHTAYMEGRFAPKGSSVGNARLLQQILGGYLAYLRDGLQAKDSAQTHSLSRTLQELDEVCAEPNARWPQRQQLALVAHFVKQPWRPRQGPYRHYKLRCTLESQMTHLRITLRDYPRLRRWVRGVDGAANEMHAPPEVFASVFRQAERLGLGHRSYHVGEDFPHLLTGVRHMLDAIELLNLRNGSRIGHGTALGIDPALWLSRMPGTLHLSRSERLLDLLAAWQLLRELPDCTMQAYQAEMQLNALLPQVFRAPVAANIFERAMRLRGLHMGFVSQMQNESNWQWGDASLVDSLREEARLVSEAGNLDPKALELLWTWHNDQKLIERSEELIEIEAQDALFTPAVYLRLQQALMARVAERRIVIETLPSSNVRISQYECFEEHHVMRWMGVPGFIKPGDVPIMVSLGSDDPGIFAGNLKGEFYQLYAVLRKHGLLDTEALRHVAAVNERGRQYRFHDPAL